MRLRWRSKGLDTVHEIAALNEGCERPSQSPVSRFAAGARHLAPLNTTSSVLNQTGRGAYRWKAHDAREHDELSRCANHPDPTTLSVIKRGQRGSLLLLFSKHQNTILRQKLEIRP